MPTQKILKHTQIIRWLLPTNCLSVIGGLVGLALKGIKLNQKLSISQSNFCFLLEKTLRVHRLVFWEGTNQTKTKKEDQNPFLVTNWPKKYILLSEMFQNTEVFAAGYQ